MLSSTRSGIIGVGVISAMALVVIPGLPHVRGDEKGEAPPGGRQETPAKDAETAGRPREINIDALQFAGNGRPLTSKTAESAGFVLIADAMGPQVAVLVHASLSLSGGKVVSRFPVRQRREDIACPSGPTTTEEGSWTARHLYLSKFPPSGGNPSWSRRWEGVLGCGAGRVAWMKPHCVCLTPRIHQALDGKGYLYIANKFSVQVIDCETGQLVGEFGSYGNMDCLGKGSAKPHPELPFGTISALAVWKDRLFVVDAINARIAKCRIVYPEAKE